ncbi:MAG: Oligopeptide-binding protein OppA [Chlamydiia bacterium]|nr:Oligopeptide-binding protein OppA [Chlamydiia bacterium]MCH9618186.1 Oligopeptide-binding protein OppA [Chlamydiia bacterium]MCH9624091.1 Oligopeptide-binding protein OppA [Chlamydiia bacterium]
MKKYIFISLALIFTTSLIISCGKKQTQKNTLNGIHINVDEDPTTFDPRKSADYISGTFQYLLFEGLVRMTPDSVAAPAYAQKVDISDDGLIYTFHLRDARWSNGVPITAYDFSQTWLDMLDPQFNSPNAHLLFPIKNAEKAKLGLVKIRDVGINVINHNTLEVCLEHPTPYFKELICFPVFSPVCQHHVQNNPSWAKSKGRDFICNGPFRLVKRTPSREIILEKNPYYWDADSVDLEQITISIVDNDMTALNMYHSGELDIIGIPFKGIPADAIPDLLDKGLIDTTDIPGSTICCFNMDKFPFTNKNIRKAFAYSINRKEIVEHITLTHETPGMHLLPEMLLPDQPEPFFQDGDIETARLHLKKGLKELGITLEELEEISLLHATSGIYPKIAQAMQEQWRKALGIAVSLSPQEYKVFLDRLAKKDFCIGQCVWVAQYHDPMNILDRFRVKESVKNYPGFDNKEYKEIIDDSVYHSNKEDRFEKLRAALNILNEEVPLTTIYHWKCPYMKKDYVNGLLIQKSGFAHLHNIKMNRNTLPHDNL